jgi:predicted nucleotidyltransferase
MPRSKLLPSKNERKVIQDFKENLLNRLPQRVYRMVLFGSRAKGTAKKGSDMDVLVVVDKRNAKSRDMILDVASRISLSSGILVSPLVLSKEEFAREIDYGTHLAKVVSSEGIVLWKRN